MNGLTVVTAAGLSTLILQGVKWLWRKFVAKDMNYCFPAWFYLVSVPVLNIAVVPLLAMIGFVGFEMPTDWMIWAQNIVQVLIGSLISVFAYNDAVAPLNAYRAMLKSQGK